MGCSDSDYDFLRQIVHTRSANLISPTRNALFEGKLQPVARSVGATSLEEFVAILRADQSPQLHRAVAEAMTVNETSFFRDQRLFNILRETILPQLIEANQAERVLRIWSAAASTGQEAYSVAMLIAEQFPQLKNWDIKILGTDISSQVIDWAQRGRYRRLDVNRGLPARMLLKYFSRDGDEWQIDEELQAMCEFRRLNLCDEMPATKAFDLVLLRNVLLYLSLPDRELVFRGVHRQIKPHGYLVLGAAEQAEDSTDQFQAKFDGNFYYYRPASPRSASTLP
jgi:chemotaxis protein methyltransferase CheR